MKSINNVVITGNLTRDLDVKEVVSGFSIGSSSVAVNKPAKDKEGNWHDETSFIDIKLKGKYAEVMAKHLKKGVAVTVHGELIQERWEDKEGAKHSRVLVDVIQIVPMSNRNGESGEENGGASAAPQSAENVTPGYEDIPF